jgi:ribosome-associated toxin RatA of RatAB toxin-antitoxin module
MKSIDGRANAIVRAGAPACFAVLAAVHRYPAWIGELVRTVEVLEWDADGQPTSARMTIHVAQSPFAKDFELVVSIQATPVESVLLRRVPNEPSDREQLEIGWRLYPDTGTRIEVTFSAVTPLLPSFVPLRGVGNEIADTLLRAAVETVDRGGT